MMMIDDGQNAKIMLMIQKTPYKKSKYLIQRYSDLDYGGGDNGIDIDNEN